MCIYGLEEESDETEEVVEAKVIELAAAMGITLVPDNISIAHRLGKPQDRNRPVIVVVIIVVGSATGKKEVKC